MDDVAVREAEARWSRPIQVPHATEPQHAQAACHPVANGDFWYVIKAHVLACECRIRRARVGSSRDDAAAAGNAVVQGLIVLELEIGRVRLFCGNLEWSDLGHLTLLRRGLETGSGSGISPFA